MDKKEILRKNLLKQRDLLTAQKRNVLSKKIYNNFKELLKNFKDIKYVMVYLPLKKEVNTKFMISYLINNGVKLYVPFIDEKDEIIPIKLYKNYKLEKGKFNIDIPVLKIKLKDLKKLDIIIIPGIGFDKNGNRIGFGKGYFDKFLKKLPQKTKKIGICFSFQIVKKIPVKKHDVKVDYIITEKEVIKIGKINKKRKNI